MMMKYFLILFLITGLLGAADAQVKVPDSVLTSLRSGHPRLFVKSLKDFEVLKSGMTQDPFLKKCSSVILHKADSILTKDTVTYDLASQLGGQLLLVSRNVYRRVYLLAMAYRLTGNRKYTDKVWGDLYAVSRFPDWNPWDFLDVAEMLHGFAIGYDWLYDVWTPEQRKVIRQAMMDKGLLRAYLGYNDMESAHLNDWPKSKSNWNQVCGGGIGLAALAIADEEPKLSNYLIRQAVLRIPNTTLKFAPDGATDEGPGYWKFGVQYNVALIACLESALGTDFGLSQLPGFSKTGQYFLSMGSNNGKIFDYADCWESFVQSPELFWFARKYNQPLLATYEKAHPSYNVLEMLWYDPALKGGASLPPDNYYRGAEVATIRSSWDDPNDWFVGFKAGTNTANHGHLDIGNFVIERNGKRWAMDLQHDSYELPGYFDVLTGQRWTYYRMRAEGHNTLVMNPDLQPDQDPKAGTTIGKFISGPSASFGIIDMTAAYGAKTAGVKRGITLLQKKRVLVQDEINLNKPLDDLYWFMQTAADIKLSADKRTAILMMGQEKLKVVLAAGPAGAAFEIMEARPLPAAPHPEKQEANKDIHRLTIHMKNVGSTTLAVLFQDENDRQKVAIKPLKNW